MEKRWAFLHKFEHNFNHYFRVSGYRSSLQEGLQLTLWFDALGASRLCTVPGEQ